MPLRAEGLGQASLPASTVLWTPSRSPLHGTATIDSQPELAANQIHVRSRPARATAPPRQSTPPAGPVVDQRSQVAGPSCPATQPVYGDRSLAQNAALARTAPQLPGGHQVQRHDGPPWARARAPPRRSPRPRHERPVGHRHRYRRRAARPKSWYGWPHFYTGERPPRSRLALSHDEIEDHLRP